MRRVQILLPVVLCFACASDSAETASPGPGADAASVVEGLPAAAPAHPDVTALGLSNGRTPFPGVVTAGQLTDGQVVALAEAGYDVFVCLRPSAEQGTGWEEDFAAERDLTFHRVPVAGAAGVTMEATEAMARILDESEGRGVVVYCASSNRVGALFALQAHFVDGLPAEQAIDIGRRAGLASLEPVVRRLLDG